MYFSGAAVTEFSEIALCNWNNFETFEQLHLNAFQQLHLNALIVSVIDRSKAVV